MALPSQGTMVRNICRTFRNASATHRAMGYGWYPHARYVASQISPDDPALGAGVLAGMSPRLQWSVNVTYADIIVKAARAGQSCPEVGLTNNRYTSWAIATGTPALDALGTVSPTGRIVSGHKVRSFYRNIMGDRNSVTVDMWAYAVATSRWTTDARTGARVPMDARMTGVEYDAIASAYRRAAVILSREVGETVHPRECQAVCWVSARGVKPSDVDFHVNAAAHELAA